jgi:2-oxoglutarate/2-oxoacid ferredoxin oxidoreductase subunit beta
VIDVVSPCVQFNNSPQSTKSYDFVREHNEAVNRIDFITPREPIHVDYAPGTVETVTQHDGSVLKLAKLHEDYNPHDRVAAMTYLQARHAAGEIVTGLLFLEPEPKDIHVHLNTVAAPLNRLNEAELCPGAKALDAINETYR